MRVPGLKGIFGKLGWLSHNSANRNLGPVVPVLSETTRVPYGAFKFKIQTPNGTVCTILASPDLKNWMPLATDSAGTIGEYIDSEAPKFSHSFIEPVPNLVDAPTSLGMRL